MRVSKQLLAAFAIASVLHGAAFAALYLQPTPMELPTDDSVVIDLGLLGAIGQPEPAVINAESSPQVTETPPKPTPKPPPVKPRAEPIIAPPQTPQIDIAPLPIETVISPQAETIVPSQPSQQRLTEEEALPIETEPVSPPQQGASTTDNTANTGQPASPAAGLASAMNSGASGPEQDYYAKLSARMKRYKRYPDSARKDRIEGTVILQFTVIRNGRITRSKVVQSSGYQVLDSASLRILKRVQPLPAFPREMKQRSITVTYPFEFKLIDE